MRAGDIERSARLDDGQIAPLEKLKEAASVRRMTIRRIDPGGAPCHVRMERETPVQIDGLHAAPEFGAGTCRVGRRVV